MNNISNELPVNPTASLFFDGLGVCCFGADPKRAEFGFIKADGHELEIYICDKNKNVIASFPSSEVPSLDGGEIFIETTDMVATSQYHHPLARDLDTSDFRWMPDIDRIYDSAVEFVENATANLHAKIYLNGGVLYTKTLSESNAYLKDTETQREAMSLGRVGRVLGADVASEEVKIRIVQKNNEVFELILAKGHESPYYVDIRYNCGIPGRSDELSDFHEIYKIVQPSATEPRYSLEYDALEEPWQFVGSSTVMTTRIACNFVVLGKKERNLPVQPRP